MTLHELARAVHLAAGGGISADEIEQLRLTVRLGRQVLDPAEECAAEGAATD